MLKNHTINQTGHVMRKFIKLYESKLNDFSATKQNYY